MPTVADLEGVPVSLDSLAGRVVALSFWTSWCMPCMAAVPEEREMVERLADEPFTFLGVSSDPTVERARATAAARGMTWRNLWVPIDGGVVETLNVTQWPTVFVLDGAGRIRAKFTGSALRPRFATDDVEAAVRRVLAETTSGDRR
jgi:thiol-disulfide isomerase/thioredoxin